MLTFIPLWILLFYIFFIYLYCYFDNSEVYFLNILVIFVSHLILLFPFYLVDFNLSKAIGKQVAESKIKTNISDLNNSLVLLMTEYMKADNEYNTIKNDYTVNSLHFENRAIIEGIRNAIAHGNDEFNVNGEFYDTEIIFNDIYEGKNTFSVKITFKDFEEMIDRNYDIILDYVRNKINGIGRK